MKTINIQKYFLASQYETTPCEMNNKPIKIFLNVLKLNCFWSSEKVLFEDLWSTVP